MKTIDFLVLSASLAGLLVLTACGRGNEKDGARPQNQVPMTEIGNKESEDAAEIQREHEELQNNFAHQDIIFLKNVSHPSESTKKELKEVVNAYLTMKDALVNDNIAEVDEAASLMHAIFCPMAFDGKGAYWITESREIRNPYFGEKMLNCGEVKEKL